MQQGASVETVCLKQHDQSRTRMASTRFLAAQHSLCFFLLSLVMLEGSWIGVSRQGNGGNRKLGFCVASPLGKICLQMHENIIVLNKGDSGRLRCCPFPASKFATYRKYSPEKMRRDCGVRLGFDKVSSFYRGPRVSATHVASHID